MASLEQINYQPHRAEISDGSLQWAPLKRKPIKNPPQIVWEDNSTWAEANLWALDQATSSKRDLKTVRSNMSHLLVYAKWLEAESIQWWHFPERESERCLVCHPGVSCKKLSKYKYLLQIKGRRWYLWPRSGRYQHLTQDGGVSEVFMEELSDFYHRYLTGELQFPENFGKTWSKIDEEVLYDMIDYACTVRQIAVEMKRHPVSAVNELAKYPENGSIQNRITQVFYDVPVQELIHWF